MLRAASVLLGWLVHISTIALPAPQAACEGLMSDVKGHRKLCMTTLSPLHTS